MTIYFKDGTSRDVHKITFRGNVAELFLIDGSIVTVPVEKLDLPSSGIGAPVGTYGTSKVTGSRRPALSDKKGVLGDPLKQTRLKEEWARSEKIATVTSSIGPMQRGDTVKIVGETTPNTRPSREDYYDQTEFEYDAESRRYRFRAKDLDHAYVVVYKNQDGTYGKRLFDAVTFNSHFQLKEVPKPQPTMPEYPVIPDKKDPDVRETTPLSGPQIKPESTEPETTEQEAPPAVQQQEETTLAEQPETEQKPVEAEKPSRRSSWIAYAIFIAVVLAIGLGAWFILARGQRPYIDASKFSRYEDDLREFEIAIWLRNGKTADQLMEICLKKFYQDSPSILSVCNRMLKGTQKALVIPFIAKQTNRSVVEAERIYDQIHNQMERIRHLIQDVSQRTGISPAKPPVEITPTTASKGTVPTPPPLPKHVQVASQQPAPVAGNSTSSVALNPVSSPDRPVSAHLIEPQSPMRTATDLPSYANSVLNQISFLSSREEK
ncbi:hypothetical protein L0156_25415 [bacterium]|nr:hypothetical protein [bacterium]